MSAAIDVQTLEGQRGSDKVCGHSQIGSEKWKDVIFDRDVFAASNGEMLEDRTIGIENVSMELCAGYGGVVEVEPGQSDVGRKSKAEKEVEGVGSLVRS